MTISAHSLLDKLSRDFIEDRARRHKKVCDECYGRGWVGGFHWKESDKLESVVNECAHCNGTGWQHAE